MMGEVKVSPALRGRFRGGGSAGYYAVIANIFTNEVHYLLMNSRRAPPRPSATPPQTTRGGLISLSAMFLRIRGGCVGGDDGCTRTGGAGDSGDAQDEG